MKDLRLQYRNLVCDTGLFKTVYPHGDGHIDFYANGKTGDILATIKQHSAILFHYIFDKDEHKIKCVSADSVKFSDMTKELFEKAIVQYVSFYNAARDSVAADSIDSF